MPVPVAPPQRGPATGQRQARGCPPARLPPRSRLPGALRPDLKYGMGYLAQYMWRKLVRFGDASLARQA
jgi:hypothetical protein